MGGGRKREKQQHPCKALRAAFIIPLAELGRALCSGTMLIDDILMQLKCFALSFFSN